MRKVLCLFILLTSWIAAVPGAFAQAHNPVAWTLKSAPHSSVKPGSKFDVTVTATVEAGWHLYAMEEPDHGPVATQVGIAEDDSADLLRVGASKAQTIHDNSFNVDTPVYLSTAEFTLHLRAAASPSLKPLHVLVRYQSCNNNVCLAPRTSVIEVPVHISQ